MLRNSFVGILLGISIVALSFQNCGQPGELALKDSSSLSADQAVLNTPRDPITLISNPRLTINNGAEFTRSVNVELQISALGAEEMLISDSLDCQNGQWEAYSQKRAWTLIDENREGIVYAKFRKKGVPETACINAAITHDNIAPTLTVLTKAPSFTNKAVEQVDFKAEDFGSGIKTVKCTTPDGTEIQCQSSYQFGNLAKEGSHSVKIVAVDKAGNYSNPLTESLIVDKTAPKVSINGPQGAVAQQDATIKISVIESNGIASVQCRLQPLEMVYKDCSALEIKYQGLTTGQYHFDVKVKDLAQNEGVAELKWEVDLSVPNVKITKAPAAITNKTEAEFEFSGTSGNKVISIFSCRLDNQAAVACQSPYKYVNLTDKEYTFTLVGVNDLGTSSAPQSYKWIVDTEGPTVEILSGPTGVVKDPGATFVIEAKDPNGIKSVECSLDSSAYTNCSSMQVSYVNLADGPHTFRARATDSAGNTVYSEEKKWSVDTTPDSEILANIMPNPVKENTQGTLNIQVTQVTQASYQCKTKVSQQNLVAGNVTQNSMSVNFVVNEDLVCEIKGKDKAGNDIKKIVEADVGCGNRFKKDGRCTDFPCLTVVNLPLTDPLVIPERTQAGLCYSVKLFNAVTNSSSSLTKVFDNEVVSSNHDGSGPATRNPYVLGKANVNFILGGPRVVKLAGSSDPTSKILIDNFVMVGLYPKQIVPSTDFYHSYGTKDSAVDSARTYIRFKNQPVPLTPFASGGTATVTPLEIVSEADSELDYTLDIRALDCGGIRELSDVYLLFQ